MDTMNISSHDYHIRMLNDLACQNNGALILLYDGGEKIDNTHSAGAISIMGKPIRVLSLLTNLTANVAEKCGMDVEDLLDIMKEVVMEQKGNADESKKTSANEQPNSL